MDESLPPRGEELSESATDDDGELPADALDLRPRRPEESGSAVARACDACGAGTAPLRCGRCKT